MSIIAFTLLTSFTIAGCVVFAEWISRNIDEALGGALDDRRDQVSDFGRNVGAKLAGGEGGADGADVRNADTQQHSVPVRTQEPPK